MEIFLWIIGLKFDGCGDGEKSSRGGAAHAGARDLPKRLVASASGQYVYKLVRSTQNS